MTTDQQPRLHEALRALADVPAPIDTGTAALRRARHIRRRRGGLAGVATVVAVAVALIGVRVGLMTGAPQSAADPASGPAGPAGPRYGVSGYLVQPRSMQTGRTMLFDPRSGRYVAVAVSGTPSPDGSRVLIQGGQLAVIDRDALLAGQLDRAWQLPIGPCEASWSADSRRIRCTGLPSSSGLPVSEADVVTHQTTASTVRTPMLQDGHVFPAAGCRADEFVLLGRANHNSLHLQVVDRAGQVRVSYSLPGGWGLAGRAPADFCSPDGRYLLGGDGRALDLRTGQLIGHALPDPPATRDVLAWYDDTHYLRLDFETPRTVLRVIDLRSAAALQSVVIGQDRGNWLIPWLTRLDGPSRPGQLAI